jgi:ubiquinol-cytochrome c reductase cytochrome c1 subunit
MKTRFARRFAGLIAAATILFTGAAHASGEAPPLDKWPAERGHDLAALQNGAKLFANYCLNCHSASQMRWNRLTDIGLSAEQIKSFLIFGDQKVGDLMTIAMPPRDGKAWLGAAPPDLSVIVRARTSFEYKGTDYLYTLLRSFYRDKDSATGWNNVVFPSIGMPHVLWERQGERQVTIDRVLHATDEKTGQISAVREVASFDARGNKTLTRTPLAESKSAGTTVSFTPADAAAARAFDSDVADLVAYLNFMTDPSGPSRARIGLWVMLLLIVFAAAAWWLNREFWKNMK